MKRILTFALLLSMLLGLSSLAFAQEEPATFVLKNGTVYTMNENLDVVSAIAVRGNEIVYVGDDEGAEAFIGADTKVVDLDGKMVTPGFINGHDHINGAEYFARTRLSLRDFPHNLNEYAVAIQDYANANPEMEAIQIGDMDLKVFGEDIPNNEWLNQAMPDRIVIVNDESGHGTLLNQKAMDTLGITDSFEDPEGSLVYRYDDGSLTGYFSDCPQIVDPLTESIVFPDSIWFDAFDAFQKEFVAAGVTTLDDGGLFPDEFVLLHQADEDGILNMRFQAPLMCNDTDNYSADYARERVAILDGLQEYKSDFVHLNQIKIIIDGVPEGKSALLMEPYAETAGMGNDYYGPTYTTQENLDDMVSIFNQSGYQVLIHSMGDGGCHKSIEAFIKSQKENNLSDMRNVVIHSTLVTDEDIRLAGDNNIYLNTSPVWFYLDPQFSELELTMFGEERFYREYNIRDRLEAGCIMTGGADCPASLDFTPLTGIEVCCTQGSPYVGEQGDPAFVRNEDQTISVMDALKMYTINGAMQCKMEDMVGTLEVGKKADMVILAEDITQIDVVDISETEIVNTIYDGRVVYGDEL